MPTHIDGQKQSPLPGVSMRYSFDKAKAATTKKTQYYELAGTRGIWHKGWKASAVHAPMPSNQGKFDKDRWQLFHVDKDRAEAFDLADKYPAKVKEMVKIWMAEAKKYNVLPLIDVDVHTIHELEYHAVPPESGSYTYYPGTTEIPEASSARTLGSSFKIHAELEFTGESQGIICAQGSRFGGYSFFVKGGKLVFVYNFLGISPEQRLACDAPPLGKHVVGVEFAKESLSKNLEVLGSATLTVDGKEMGRAKFRTQSGHYALCGEGLCIGYDGGDAVSAEYQGKFPFSGGRIIKVVFDVAKDIHVDKARKMAAALARD
jgi:arylsulfatase